MCKFGDVHHFIEHCLIPFRTLHKNTKYFTLKDELLSSNGDIEDYPAIDDNEIERDDDQGQSVYDILGLSDSEPG